MNKPTKEDQETLKSAFNDVDFLETWHEMHTPQVHKFRKVGRNEICPFCNSGKKFKNCECYKTHKDLELEESFYDKVVRLNKEEAEKHVLTKESMKKLQKDKNAITKCIRENGDVEEVMKERNLTPVKPI